MGDSSGSMTFRSPIPEMLLTMTGIAGLDDSMLGDMDLATVEAILSEAGRFAESELLPLDAVGDRVGATFAGGQVTTAPGWRETYRKFADGGWCGTSASTDWGGQGLPVTVDMAVQELWNAGCAAFAVGPMLTSAAIMALEAHASDDLKATYLPKLCSGTWPATMNLTEPQAGSDLGALSSTAQPQPDGTYRVSGQKIFITYGDHDLTDNIVHLVLARLPEAPAGSRGISLFLVPKYLLGPDDEPAEANSVTVAGIEEKLGLHGAPTCTMIYDDAVGYLVGEPHQGLACMFTMMNVARLSVGIQAVGVSESAFQRAADYARERRQGRAAGWSGDGPAPIVMHPDVQAMLLRMKALTAAARALCYACAVAIDRGRDPTQAKQAQWRERAALLTPIAKAFATDAGIEVASLGIQVHGGAGYIEETGAAQHLRDVRIFAIYEGTNGIQAIDLVTRKIAAGDGFERLAVEMDGIAALSGRHALTAAVERLRKATATMTNRIESGDRQEALAVATPYCRMFGLTLGGALLVKGAQATEKSGDSRMAAIAGHYLATILPETTGLAEVIDRGGSSLSEYATGILS